MGFALLCKKNERSINLKIKKLKINRENHTLRKGFSMTLPQMLEWNGLFGLNVMFRLLEINFIIPVPTKKGGEDPKPVTR